VIIVSTAAAAARAAMIAPMPSRRRTKTSDRTPAAAPTASARGQAPTDPPATVDTETLAALALFNSRHAAQAESERAKRRVERAAEAKEAAAARVRELERDTKATVEQRNEAAAAYHAAVAAWDRARSGEPDPTSLDQTIDERAGHDTTE